MVDQTNSKFINLIDVELEKMIKDCADYLHLKHKFVVQNDTVGIYINKDVVSFTSPQNDYQAQFCYAEGNRDKNKTITD
jgi:hypothetical protein